ncbi:CHAT domain-containing protein [Flavobacteriaceae bacterium TK19130]|nr:CHAT domain-containing protein [Thermobacterium salinum]
MLFGSFRKCILPTLLLLAVFLFWSEGFSQQLEEQLYQKVDSLVANPSLTYLQNLKSEEEAMSKQISSNDEALAYVILLCNEGYYFERFGKLSEAIQQYEQAWKLFKNRNLKGYDIIAYCLQPLGNLYTKVGAFNSAESTIKTYIDLAEEKGASFQKVAGILNLSTVYNASGYFKLTTDLLSNALDVEALTASQRRTLMNNAAVSYMAQKKVDTTATILQQLQQEFQEPTVSELKLNAQVQVVRKNYSEAISLLNRAEEMLFQQDNTSARDLARLYLEKADVYRLINKKRQAAQELKAALKLLLPQSDDSLPAIDWLYSETSLIGIFDQFGDLNATENPEKAIAYYERSQNVSRLLHTEYTAQQTQILQLSDARKRTEKVLQLYYNAYSETKNKDFFEKALQWADASKALVLSKSLTKQKLRAKYPSDTLLEKERELTFRYETMVRELVDAQRNNKVDQITSLNAQISSLTIQLKEARKAINQKYSTNDKLFSLAEVQQRLVKDEAIAYEFFYGEEYMYVFELTSDSFQWNRVSLQNGFHEKIQEFVSLFDAPETVTNNVSRYKKLAFDLFQKLQLSKQSEFSNLVLVPDGILSFVPFDALLTKPSASNQFEEMPFLVTSYNTAYASSFSQYMHYSKETISNEEIHMLGVFPVFEGTPNELFFSKKEAKAFQNAVDAKVLINEAATRQDFLDQLPKFSGIHISSHAYGGTASHPARIEFYDESLQLQELYSLNLKTELVVLSACETGVGALYKGEGPINLARGFQYAGAKNVVVTLWKVNDLATAKGMENFYKKFSEHHSAFTANSEAKRAYLEDGNISNPKKSPYYWAAFSYFGDVQKPNSSSSFSYWWFLGLLPIGFAAVCLFRR